MLTTLALIALAQCDPEGPIFSCPSTMASYALFEFAPADGAGMGAACACTTPTGAKGEVLTFTRASSAWCTKGNETSGIANGDLVECASGQPRVMPGGDGTGGLGLGVWDERSNYILRSQEIDNGAWFNQVFGGPGGITVTADYAVAPDGTTTAERLQIPALTTGTQYTLRSQTFGAGGTYACGLYIKGNGTSGSVNYYFDGVPTCQTATYNATTWTRAVSLGAVGGGAFNFGNDTLDCGGTSAPAQDILLWQVDCQIGSYISPPITTTGTAATRVAEVASVAWPVGTAAVGSCAATAQSSAFGGLIESATVPRPLFFTAGPSLYSNDQTTNAGPISVTLTSPLRVWASWGGSDHSVSDSVTTATAGAFDGTMMSDGLTTYLGGIATASGPLNGTIKRVCVDPSPTRCR